MVNDRVENLPPAKNLKVAALVDLPRTAHSGGHVKCWERLAEAAATGRLPLDLTVYYSGPAHTEILGPQARLKHLPPVFSTANLKFLPYVPDHTDLSPWHFGLAKELRAYDVIHTTDGFFAFAKTAEKISRRYAIPLVTSFHTDTPSYARIFTRQTIKKIFGNGTLGQWLTEGLQLPEKQAAKMERRLKQHVSACQNALVTRAEDHQLAESILGFAHVHHLRLGVNKAMFGPHRRDKNILVTKFGIPQDALTFLFVGRLDIGKNIYTLIEALEQLIAQGHKLHLITAGIGPASTDLRQRLGSHVSIPGFVPPDELAQLYASVDALALCSEVEIRSMAGVEALASGCPVLVARKNGVAELFNHTPAMMQVESGSAAWTEALRTFITNAGVQENMRQTALDYGRTQLAEWQNVLTEDLFSVWQNAFESK